MRLSHIFSVAIKWKKLLIINLSVIVIFTTVVSFLIPEKFKSISTVMIEEDASSSLLSGILPDVGSVLGGALFGSSGESVEKMFSYLESRKMLLKIIEEFDLINYYDVTDFKIDKTLKAISDDIDFDLTENGLIQISFIHKDPKTAADIVSFIISELRIINKQFAASHATNYRKFVEQRYNKNLSDLALAEENLQLFQEKMKIYTVPEQFEIVFNALAELESKLAIKELELEYIKKINGIDSPSYKNVSTEVKILRDKINNITSGKSSVDNSILAISIEDIPLLTRNYLDLYRNVEIQNKLLEVTLPLYEQAIMEEQKNIPTIIILDEPNIPQLKDSPKKAYIIIGVFLFFFFIHIYIVLRGENSLQNDEKQMNLFEKEEKAFFSKIIRFYKLKLKLN